MSKLMAVVWSWIYVIPLIILSTAFFGVVSFAISLFDRTPARQLKVARIWARSLLRIVGVKVTVEGLDRIQPGGNYVFVSNHVSYMDIPVVLGNIPEQFLFLAKSELFKIPFLGTHLKTAGHVSVPQENPRSSIRTLQHTAALLHDGRSTLVFPEGGRSETGELREFKDGAAFLAIRAQIPLVPMAMIGLRSILRMHTLTFHRGAVTLRIGEPIPTEGMTTHQRAELTALSRERIVEMLSRSITVAARNQTEPRQ